MEISSLPFFQTFVAIESALGSLHEITLFPLSRAILVYICVPSFCLSLWKQVCKAVARFLRTGKSWSFTRCVTFGLMVQCSASGGTQLLPFWLLESVPAKCFGAESEPSHGSAINFTPDIAISKYHAFLDCSPVSWLVDADSNCTS